MQTMKREEDIRSEKRNKAFLREERPFEIIKENVF